MKLLPVLFVLTAVLAFGGESYFFRFAKDGKPVARWIEDQELRTVRPIEKVDPPGATAMYAFHQGLGKGRAYQIQVNLKEHPEHRWFPQLVLDDEVIIHGLVVAHSSGERRPSSFSLEGDDPDKIRRWSGLLSELLGIPEDRIAVDLSKESGRGDESSAGGREPEPGDVIEYGTIWHLDGESEWRLKGGPVITLRESKEEGISFHGSDGKELFRLGKHEQVGSMVKSPRGRVLLFEVSNDDGFGGCVLRVSAEEQAAKFERILVYPKTPLFKGKRWWVSDLGAVSDDGDLVLARFGWQPQGVSKVSYEWQTWSVRDAERLGRGLQIANGGTKKRPKARARRRESPSSQTGG